MHHIYTKTLAVAAGVRRWLHPGLVSGAANREGFLLEKRMTITELKSEIISCAAAVAGLKYLEEISDDMDRRLGDLAVQLRDLADEVGNIEDKRT